MPSARRPFVWPRSESGWQSWVHAGVLLFSCARSPPSRHYRAFRVPRSPPPSAQHCCRGERGENSEKPERQSETRPWRARSRPRRPQRAAQHGRRRGARAVAPHAVASGLGRRALPRGFRRPRHAGPNRPRRAVRLLQLRDDRCGGLPYVPRALRALRAAGDAEGASASPRRCAFPAGTGTVPPCVRRSTASRPQAPATTSATDCSSGPSRRTWRAPTSPRAREAPPPSLAAGVVAFTDVAVPLTPAPAPTPAPRRRPAPSSWASSPRPPWPTARATTRRWPPATSPPSPPGGASRASPASTSASARASAGPSPPTPGGTRPWWSAPAPAAGRASSRGFWCAQSCSSRRSSSGSTPRRRPGRRWTGGRRPRRPRRQRRQRRPRRPRGRRRGRAGKRGVP